MNFNNFAEKYLNKEKFVISDLILEAEKNLKSIEGQINDLEKEASKYKQFIKDISNKTKNQYNDSFDYYCNFNMLNDSYQNIIDKIINLFESGDDTQELTTKFIISKISLIEDHAEVIKSLQWLINKSILVRNNNFKFIKGDKWEIKDTILN